MAIHTRLIARHGSKSLWSGMISTLSGGEGVALNLVDVGVGCCTQKGGACQQACDLDLFGIGQRPAVDNARPVSAVADFVVVRRSRGLHSPGRSALVANRAGRCGLARSCLKDILIAKAATCTETDRTGVIIRHCIRLWSRAFHAH